MVKKILSGISYKNKSTKFSNFSSYVSTSTIEDDSDVCGYVIYIHSKSAFLPNNKSDIVQDSKISFTSVKGSSKLISSTIKKCKKLSTSSSTVLITGETGTGKGLLANAIHNESLFNSGPFIAVNCTSIPETLFESELFGYEEGAFTGAKRGGKPGKFELACGGTIFLDEIGELPFHMQAKLLTVLQNRSIERVGGITSIPVNVRVIAATNKDLYDMVENKTFRSDLYYRLNVIPIELPPLRMRKSDIQELSFEFLEEYNTKLGKNIVDFSNEVMDILMNYNWPGNIREVQNVIEYAVNFEDSNKIQTENLPERLLINNLNPSNNTKYSTKEIELEHIISKLNIYGWDGEGKKKAANNLGIGVRTLYRRLEKYDQNN
jgi:transcriptional regulator with PAS, ATPase and Fis domain